MADDSEGLRAWFEALPDEIGGAIKDRFRAAVEKHAGYIRDAAPEGKTDHLKESVRVSETRDPLTLVIEAGGPLTTKEVHGGSGGAYDYALGEEFGNSHEPARPFFYNTSRAHQDELVDDLQKIVDDAGGKL